jgi:sugar phosphate permease
MTSQVGAALSPLLVVPIQIRYGWRAPFFVFGLVGVIWSLAWYSWFRDSPHDKRGVTEAELREIGSAPGLQRHGMPWATALRMPALWRIAAIGVCYVYVLGFFQAWLQTYLVKGRGFTELALALSSLTYVVGATANGLGGIVGDWAVRRYGLRNGRRSLGVAGLSAAALFLTAAIFAPNGNVALAFLSFAYGGILFQQPTLCALCLDVGRKNAGALFGFMNTAANVASAVSSVVFGYMVGYFGNYNTPFIPMVALLSLGALLWLRVDPTLELLPEALPDESLAALASLVPIGESARP